MSAYRARVAACHEHVVRLAREGVPVAEIAAEVGYCSENVYRIMHRYGVPPIQRRQVRIKTFEDGLQLGLTVHQALSDAGWVTPGAAMRTYLRAGRKAPEVLMKANRKYAAGHPSRQPAWRRERARKASA